MKKLRELNKCRLTSMLLAGLLALPAAIGLTACSGDDEQDAVRASQEYDMTMEVGSSHKFWGSEHIETDNPFIVDVENKQMCIANHAGRVTLKVYPADSNIPDLVHMTVTGRHPLFDKVIEEPVTEWGFSREQVKQMHAPRDLTEVIDDGDTLIYKIGYMVPPAVPEKYEWGRDYYYLRYSFKDGKLCRAEITGIDFSYYNTSLVFYLMEHYTLEFIDKANYVVGYDSWLRKDAQTVITSERIPERVKDKLILRYYPAEDALPWLPVGE